MSFKIGKTTPIITLIFLLFRKTFWRKLIHLKSNNSWKTGKLPFLITLFMFIFLTCFFCQKLQRFVSCKIWGQEESKKSPPFRKWGLRTKHLLLVEKGRQKHPIDGEAMDLCTLELQNPKTKLNFQILLKKTITSCL